MSGLLDSLSSATSALTAFRTGLDVAGQNIANINTDGYSRRTVALAELPPVDQNSAGRGVTVVAIQAARDQFLDARIGHEQAGAAHDSTLLNGLTEIESAVGLPGSSIDAQLTAFFDAYSQLSSDPTSPSARDGVVTQGQLLGQAFSQLSGRISDLQRATNASVVSSVDDLNQLSAQVADLNGQIVTNGANVQSLIDQRSVALGKLAELADVAVVSRSDGAVDVTLRQGGALVVGAHAYGLTATPAPPSGSVSLTLGGLDVTGTITNGTIGGLLELRDTTLPGYQANLDQLAYDVATQVNGIHSTGYDGNGAAAGNFFTPPATVAGTAASLTVDSAVAADSQLVAASSTGAVGDNQAARAIAGLRDARVMSGGATPAEAWSNFVYRVGSDVAGARTGNTTSEQVVQQLQQLRDQASGVTLDEEAAQLMRFQRAYEASARYFSTVVSTLDTLMTMVR